MSPQTDLVFNCEELLTLLPDYAFGLTDPEQTRWVETNIARCPEAVAQLEDYRRLQEEMRASVPEIDVPVGAGARLLARLETEVAAAPAPSMVLRSSLPESAPLSLPESSSGEIAISPRRRLRWLGAALAAAVLALIVTNVYWLTRVADLTQSHDLLAALLSAQNANNAFVLTSTDTLHWVRLADPNPDQNAAAFMMWNAQSKTGLLYARSFPDLQPGYKYHVWLTRPNERIFMGILQVDEKGDGALLFSSPEPINDFSWAWVTAQTPEQSSGAPVGDPVVKGELNPT
ncbi:MAG: hypothetical protein GC204_14515 [Chloroflexi bacterium]|nr:hypothetical protein [Chloroflexota bacterium]